jgi:hypothetical protein
VGACVSALHHENTLINSNKSQRPPMEAFSSIPFVSYLKYSMICHDLCSSLKCFCSKGTPANEHQMKDTAPLFIPSD